MSYDPQHKVEARHLKRKAYLYVRQSSMRQVLENQESTKRQYALRERALAMGWPGDQIVVIDEDLGRSGASAVERTGFQRLVADVGIGQAGMVMGLEFSRLARNSSDWHRLLEICALSDTLLLDEDGLYDPAHFNDRLLLGLKGAMSEAELHVLKARLIGGLRAKARRGELICPLPTGFVYDGQGKVMLDPDAQVQAAIHIIFTIFSRGESACGVLKQMRSQGLQVPMRQRHGPFKGELFWRDATHSRILDILHNPRYAGTFFYGRCRQRKRADGKRSYEKLPQDQWLAHSVDAHPGYIDSPTYEENQKRLRSSMLGFGSERPAGPPREGSALLQGMVLCGRCGRRMTIHYADSRDHYMPVYKCERDAIDKASPACQRVAGRRIDQAVARELLSALTPLAMSISMEIQREVEKRHAEADALKQMDVQRATELVELARRRYMRVDPDRRMVADALELEWNSALKAQDQAQQAYGRWQQAQKAAKDQMSSSEIAELACDFQELWRDSATPDRERKRILRLLVADVTLNRQENGDIDVHMRYKTGTTQSLRIDGFMKIWQIHKTPEEVLKMLDDLLNDCTDAQTAERPNALGIHPSLGKQFSAMTVRNLRVSRGILSHHRRLQARGLISARELAKRLEVCYETINIWRQQGRLRCYLANDKGEYLYEVPTDDKSLLVNIQFEEGVEMKSPNPFDQMREVQYAG